MAKTAVSLYPSASEASSIVRRLEEAGISSGSICTFSESGSNNRFWSSDSSFGEGSSTSTADRVGSYLMRNGVPASDAHSYAEGVRRGHSLVAVLCENHEADRVLDILDGDDALDLDEQESSWRSEGWTGYNAGAVGAAGSTATGMGAGLMGSGAAGSGAMGMGRTSTGERDEVIPVAEEELHVGKRETNRGRVRIHSHVIERPVQEQVSLREERVHVERRPVEGSERTGAVSGEGLFKERTIEMEERAEEAVVSKEARVKEELVIKKDVEQRTETISDTVRSTKVEVEDERGNHISGTGTKDRR